MFSQLQPSIFQVFRTFYIFFHLWGNELLPVVSSLEDTLHQFVKIDQLELKMKIFTRIVAVAAACLIAGSLPAQAPQKLKTYRANSSQEAVSRKISADDLQELKASGTIISEADLLVGDNYAAPAAQRTMACPTAFIMNTPYNSNNGQRGCMFDVLAANTLTISCFESNVYAGTTANYEIYYHVGTHVGVENNAGAWTLLGSATGVTSAGNNLPTPLPIPIGVTIPAGQTYSFYITNDFGGGTSYTDGTAVGNFLAADANLTVYEGVGKSYPFGLTFNVRNFNGHIFYDLGSSLDGESASISAERENDQVSLAWEIPSAKDFQNIELEYASDGHTFASMQTLDNRFDSGQLRVAPQAEENWYRLRLTSANGEQQFSNIEKISFEAKSAFRLQGIAPNPSQNDVQLHLLNDSDESVRIQITDALGKTVYETNAPNGDQQLTLPMADFKAGIYLLSLSCEGQRETRRLIHQ